MKLTEKEIIRHIARHRAEELPRLCRLGAYYRGEHAILRGAKEPGKPDNRLVNNFCRSITDETVGYFLGIPVAYSSEDEATEAAILRLGHASDEPFVNAALARDLSVYGRAAEILWYDAKTDMPRFAPVDVTGVIPVWGDSLDGGLKAAIRLRDEFDEKGNKHTVAEVYDEDDVTVYAVGEGTVTRLTSRLHGFGAVPVNFYRNNRDGSGDFEPVISLVDAYNRLQSESVNDFELFADSYLAISGMGGTTAEDVRKLREDRVLLLDEGGEAKWLTKTVNDAYIENLKTRIAKDIYRFSCTVDMAEETALGTSLSGTAIRYRLLNFDNRVKVTEQFFRKGLRRRWALLCRMLTLTGTPADADSLRMRFVRNLPSNLGDATSLAVAAAPLVSRRTALEMLPFVRDPDAELARIREEAAAGIPAGAEVV